MSIFATGLPFLSRPQRSTTITTRRLFMFLAKTMLCLQTVAHCIYFSSYSLCVPVNHDTLGSQVSTRVALMTVAVYGQQLKRRKSKPISTPILCSLAYLWFSSIQKGKSRKSPIWLYDQFTFSSSVLLLLMFILSSVLYQFLNWFKI